MTAATAVGAGLVPGRHDAAVADPHAHRLAADEAQLVGQLVHVD